MSGGPGSVNIIIVLQGPLQMASLINTGSMTVRFIAVQ